MNHRELVSRRPEQDLRPRLGSGVALALLALAACAPPTAPSRSASGKKWTPALMVRCVTSPALTCTATLDTEDVTAKAIWSAGESFRTAMDVPITASSAVTFRSPGVPTALREQNIYVRADYDSPEWGHTRNIAPHAYALAVRG